uniref:Putative pppde peptidase domain protein n=1 Tax=Triatoma dimidiata TaxID=72491 RepID=A0A0V0GAY3_TRIDM
MSEGEEVLLYVYDVSAGVAATLSPALLGRKIDGIWHTAIIVYGKEYYFGSGGIGVAIPGSVVGEPLQKIKLGVTYIPFQVFEEYVNGLAESEFRGDAYHILKHNCNNFSDALSNFLVGTGIPAHILSLPDEIINTPFGATIRPLIEQFATNSPVLDRIRRDISPEFLQLNSDIEAARNEISNGYRMSEGAEVTTEVDPSVQLAENLAEAERKEREERRKNREPPIVFKDAVDVHIEFDALVGLIDGKLNDEEQQSLEELHQYMLQDEGSWALGDSFLVFIGRLLTDKTFGDEVSMRCLNVLSAAALKDDVILMLHQDRKQHILMNYAYEVDRLPLPQQKGITLFICNLFENSGSSEWLLYISEWPFNNTQISNIRVTTKVAVNAVLSEDEEMRDRGTAIIYNLATKEVFDDVAVELTMAILQFLNGTPVEAQLFRCLKSLAQFCQISAQDVPQLIQMIGPHPSKFKGQSERNDQLIEEISKRLR